MPLFRTLSSWTKIYGQAFEDCKKYSWFFALYFACDTLSFIFITLVLCFWGMPFSESFAVVVDKNARTESLKQIAPTILDDPWKLFGPGLNLVLFILMALLLSAFFDGVVYKSLLLGPSKKFSWRRIFDFGVQYLKKYVGLKLLEIFILVFLITIIGILAGITFKFLSINKDVFEIILIPIFIVLIFPMMVWMEFSKVGIARNNEINEALKKSWSKLKINDWWAFKGLLMILALCSGASELSSWILRLTPLASTSWHFFIFVFQNLISLLITIYSATLYARFWNAKYVRGR
jgi:hypothetical protein